LRGSPVVSSRSHGIQRFNERAPVDMIGSEWSRLRAIALVVATFLALATRERRDITEAVSQRMSRRSGLRFADEDMRQHQKLRRFPVILDD